MPNDADGGEGDLVEWRCLDVELARIPEKSHRIVQRGVEGGVGKCLRQEQEDALCAAPLGEVVMDYGN